MREKPALQHAAAPALAAGLSACASVPPPHAQLGAARRCAAPGAGAEGPVSRRGLFLMAPAAFAAGCALTPEANTYVDAARQLNRRVEVVIATNLQ